MSRHSNSSERFSTSTRVQDVAQALRSQRRDARAKAATRVEQEEPRMRKYISELEINNDTRQWKDTSTVAVINEKESAQVLKT